MAKIGKGKMEAIEVCEWKMNYYMKESIRVSQKYGKEHSSANDTFYVAMGAMYCLNDILGISNLDYIEAMHDMRNRIEKVN